MPPLILCNHNEGVLRNCYIYNVISSPHHRVMELSTFKDLEDKRWSFMCFCWLDHPLFVFFVYIVVSVPLLTHMAVS